MAKSKMENVREIVLYILCFVFCTLYFISSVPCSTPENPSHAEDASIEGSSVSIVWEKWSGLPIASIDYICDGDFSEDDVRKATVIQVGDIYSRSRIRKSIEQIHSLRKFSHIKVDAGKENGGIKLTFILTKQVKTSKVSLLGNSDLGANEISRVMKLKPGQQQQEYDESIARIDAEAIGDLYKSRGFLNSDISFEAKIDDKSKQAEVIFRISEGERPSVKEIILIGGNKAVVSYAEILKAMKKTKLGKQYQGRRDLNSDIKNVEKIYRERGYITAEIRNPRVLSEPDAIREYSEKGKHFLSEDLMESAIKNGTVVIVFEILQGKKIDIEILERREDGKVKRKDDIAGSIALHKIRKISESVLRKSADEIKNVYRSRGYYLAEVHHEVLEDKVWNFDVDDDDKGWEPLHGAASFRSADGALQVTTSDSAPQIQLSNILIDADRYQRIEIRMKVSAGSTGRLHWINSKGKVDHQDFRLVSDGRFHNYEIDLRTFKITGKSLKNLKSEDVSEDVLRQLGDIKEQKFAGPLALMDAVTAKIGEQESTSLGSLILRYAEKRQHNKWSDEIIQIQFTLTDAPNTNTNIAWIRVKMTAESIPVVFTVIRNKVMRVKTNVEVVNTEDEALKVGIERIRKQMLTRKKHLLGFWPLKGIFSDGIFDETVFEEDLKAIIALYRHLGYSQAVIVDREINADPEKGEINASIEISEGLRTQVTSVILESDSENVLDYEVVISRLPAFQNQNVEIKERYPSRVRYELNPSKPFREKDIVVDRADLIAQYADKGYFAQIEDKREFNEEGTEVVVTYSVTMGKQIKLDDDILIRGNVRTKRRIIERELSSKLLESKIFNRTEVTNSWRNLVDLGFLKSVRLSTEEVGGSEELHKLIVDVAERDAITVNVHVGSDSVAPFRAGLGASHINLWGTGRRVGGKIQVGTEGTSFKLDYAQPRFLGTRAQGLMDVYRYTDDVDYNDEGGNRKTYSEVWTGASIGLSHRLFRANNLTYGYRYEVVDYLDITDGIRKTVGIGSLETTFRRDTRKNPLNPIQGWLHAVTLEYADSFLGSDENFAKITANSMFYLRLSERIILAFAARTGYMWILSGPEHVLAPKQFSLDDYTIPRGYDWTADDVGNVLLNTTVELRFPLYRKLDGAIFFDSGYVYAEFADFDIDETNSSIGFGLRFVTPIGPIRLDYGYPVHGSGSRNPWPSFAFGYAF